MKEKLVSVLDEYNRVKDREDWRIQVYVNDCDIYVSKFEYTFYRKYEADVYCSNAALADLAADLCHVFGNHGLFHCRIRVHGIPLAVAFKWFEDKKFKRVYILGVSTFNVGNEFRDHGLSIDTCAIDSLAGYNTLGTHSKRQIGMPLPTTRIVIRSGYVIPTTFLEVPLFRHHPRLGFAVGYDSFIVPNHVDDDHGLNGYEVERWLCGPFTKIALVLAGTHDIPQRYKRSALRLLSRDLLRAIVECIPSQ
jgi:hypothetical protein